MRRRSAASHCSALRATHQAIALTEVGYGCQAGSAGRSKRSSQLEITPDQNATTLEALASEPSEPLGRSAPLEASRALGSSAKPCSWKRKSRPSESSSQNAREGENALLAPTAANACASWAAGLGADCEAASAVRPLASAWNSPTRAGADPASSSRGGTRRLARPTAWRHCIDRAASA